MQKTDDIDYKRRYEELVDALCSKSWIGRERHESVVALAERMKNSQTVIKALADNGYAPLALRDCTRLSPHDGPCNGFPRKECLARADAKD